ncbi:MAG: 30S ribosome-binding factor RbfA [Steroidobacteraceae bacterium]
MPEGAAAGNRGRLRRIESELQRVLAELIAREVKDPRVGNVTITAVTLAADMGLARVFYAPFPLRSAVTGEGAGKPAPHPSQEVQGGLTRAAGFLRGEVGRRLGLRHAPRLEFIFDDTAEKAARLTGLIDRAVGEPVPPGEDP